MRQDNCIETIESNLKKSEIELNETRKNLNEFRNLLKNYKDKNSPKYRKLKTIYKDNEASLFNLLVVRKYLQEKLCILKLESAGRKR